MGFFSFRNGEVTYVLICGNVEVVTAACTDRSLFLSRARVLCASCCCSTSVPCAALFLMSLTLELQVRLCFPSREKFRGFAQSPGTFSVPSPWWLQACLCLWAGLKEKGRKDAEIVFVWMLQCWLNFCLVISSSWAVILSCAPVSLGVCLCPYSWFCRLLFQWISGLVRVHVSV